MIVHQLLVAREFGGAAEIGIRIAENQLRDGVPAEVWLPGPGRAAEFAARAGVPVRHYAVDAALGKSVVRAGLSNLTVAAQMFLKREGLFHFHSPIVYGALSQAIKLSRAKTVVHIHLDFDQNGLNWALRHPPNVIVLCASTLEHKVRTSLPRHVQTSQKIVVVRNSVDTDRFRPTPRAAAKQKVGAPLDRPMVLMLANLAPHKGQATAIRATARLRRRGVPVCCWLAGADRQSGTPFQGELSSLISELGIAEDVRLLGFRSDTAELLQAADVLLLPSTSEGLPLTILEAQAVGVPVIAAPTAGIPEVIIDGETGYLVEAGDHDTYAARIAALLQDPTAYDKCANKARRQCLAHHRWDNYYCQIVDVYDQLRNIVPTASARRPSSDCADCISR